MGSGAGGVFGAPDQRVDRQGNEEEKRWKENVVEDADDCRQTDDAKQDNQHRGETAQCRHHGSDDPREKEFVLHVFLALPCDPTYWFLSGPVPTAHRQHKDAHEHSNEGRCQCT